VKNIFQDQEAWQRDQSEGRLIHVQLQTHTAQQSGRATALSPATSRHKWWEVQRAGRRTRTLPHCPSLPKVIAANSAETRADLGNSYVDP